VRGRGDEDAPSSLPADCPATFASAQQGNVCAVQGESCAYDQAHVCVCINAETLNDDDLPPPPPTIGFVRNRIPGAPPYVRALERRAAARTGERDRAVSTGGR
jgi:hypothetical protein